jgi:hypothetical protein
MKDDRIELELRTWMNETGAADPDRVARVAAAIDRLPARRRLPLGWLAAAASLAVVAIVVAGALLLRMPSVGPGGAPAAPIPPAPAAFAGDPRLLRCAGGDLANVLYAFEMESAANYQAHLPAMLLSPELDVDVPAFVVVFRGLHSFPGLGAAPPQGQTHAPRSFAPGSHDLCVLVGSDAETAEINVYEGVDIEGLAASIEP